MKFENSFTEGDTEAIPRIYGWTGITFLQNVNGSLSNQTSRGELSAPSHEIGTVRFGVLRVVTLNVMP